MQQPTQKSAPPRNKWDRLWLYFVIVLVVTFFVCVGGGAVVGWFFIRDAPFTGNSATTESDFATDAERVDYANGILPITLPEGTAVTRLHADGFQDFFLELEGQLPSGEIDPFIQSLHDMGLEETSPGTFEGNVGSDHIEVKIDTGIGTIQIEFFET